MPAVVYLRARYYHPSMGRFLARDPWEGDYNSPMSYNPWVYVYGNPVNWTDPSGRFPSYCYHFPQKVRSSIPGCGGIPFYCYYFQREMWKTIPGCPGYCATLPVPKPELKPGEPIIPPGGMLHQDKTLEAFRSIRDDLGIEWLEPDGRIKDEALIALIIQEFRSFNPGTKTYEESLEAVSNQYHFERYEKGCKGSCDTIAEQLLWMDAIELIYDHKFDLSDWQKHLDHAKLAKDSEYQYGSKFESWTWGNYVKESPLYYYVGGNSKADWWHGIGYSGEPYVDIAPDQWYVIFTIAQNTACNNREGGTCKGWTQKKP